MKFKDLKVGAYFRQHDNRGPRNSLLRKIKTVNGDYEALYVETGYSQIIHDLHTADVVEYEKDGSEKKILFSKMEDGQWFVSNSDPNLLFCKIKKVLYINCISLKDNRFNIDTVSEESYFKPIKSPF